MNNLVKRALDQEKELGKIVSKMKETVYQELLKIKPIDGTTVEQAGNAQYAVVKVSTVKCANMVLNPDYYLPQSQANAVRVRLKGAKTVTELISRIEKMIETGKAGETSNLVWLNPITVNWLRRFIEDGM